MATTKIPKYEKMNTHISIILIWISQIDKIYLYICVFLMLANMKTVVKRAQIPFCLKSFMISIKLSEVHNT